MRVVYRLWVFYKSDYPYKIESKFEYYYGEDVTVWFVGRVDYYSKQFKEVFKINTALKEETITPLTNNPQRGFADISHYKED